MDDVVARLRAALREDADAGPVDIRPGDANDGGPHRIVDTSGEALAARASDRSGLAGDPGALAVVRPQTTAQVAAVLAFADQTRTPVVPQGRLTGLAGAGNATPGAILLDMSGMDRILRIDREELLAVVQPGVLVADLQRAAAAQGLFYAPDPASAPIASVGGTVATNAGGMRAVKYGVTRDWVRSLEVVLAGGDVVRTRPQTVKAVAGYDLTGLLVGSEGTLGVVTEVTVRLTPAPAEPVGVAATFEDVPAALRAVGGVITGGALPATIELLDGVSIRAIRRYAATGDERAQVAAEALPEGAGAWIVIATDTPTAADDLDRYERICREHGALTVRRADDPAALDRILTARRMLNPGLRSWRGASIDGDVGVPRGRLAEFATRLAAVAAEYGVEASVAGHVGDGNLHPVVSYNDTDPGQEEAAHAAFVEIFRLAQSMGGTITGEHGIGLEKLSGLRGEMSERVLGLQRAIKAALDPHGILNPGKKLG